MSEIAIRVENLSKLYHIGRVQQRHDTIRDAVVASARNLAARIQNPKSKIQNQDIVWALKDVSFEVKRGEVLGVIGRNGAGKSTLLKILSRITEPTKGRAEIRGRVGSLLEVGTGFHPELTGRENVYLNGAILGMRKAEIERRFDEIVAFAEVEKFLDTPVKRYSSGMYVRLAFAVAAHLEPEILLVDEVLAVGDVAFQKKCLGRMEDVARGGRAVLFVSHNTSAVEALCTRCAHFDGGTLVAMGEPRATIAGYLHHVRVLSGRMLYEGTSVIKRVEINDEFGRPASAVPPGRPITVVIHLDTSGQRLARPSIGLGFNTITGQRVFTVGTYFSACELPPVCGRVRVVCEIPEFRLAPGKYTVKAAIGNDLIEGAKEIEAAAAVEVYASDFFRHWSAAERDPRSRTSIVLMESGSGRVTRKDESALQSVKRQPEFGFYFSDPYLSQARFISLWSQLHACLDERTNEAYLEIGVGPGMLTALLRHFGSTVWTVDLDRDLAPDVLASLPRLPFVSGAFDIVCAFEVLEHLPFDQLPLCLREMRRVASKRVLLSLPSQREIHSAVVGYEFKLGRRVYRRQLWRKGLGRLGDQTHHYWELEHGGVMPETILRMASAEGLEPVSDHFVPPWFHHFAFNVEKRSE